MLNRGQIGDSSLRSVGRVKWWCISRVAVWEQLILLGLFVLAAFLLFYNLQYNPRPWHDEGAALSISRTLVEDGVYAVRTSQGYQTFGPVQSVGPTVLLPVTFSFKLNGIGLVEGRIIAAGYALLTLVIFYRCGLELFGRRVALISLVLLLASPSAGFLLFGRVVLGEVPALGFFLAGWLLWARGIRTGRVWLYPIAGLLIGAAMVTKTHYAVMGLGTLVLLSIFDLFYYHQRNFKYLLVIGLIAVGCVAAWWGWQMMYFGLETFQENASKLRQLAASTTGFRLGMTIKALQFLVGSSGPVYYFWALPAVLYVAYLSLSRDEDGFILSFLLIFSALWFGYFILWIIPWPHYALAPLSIVAFFVAKLYCDLIHGFVASRQDLSLQISQPGPAKFSFSPKALVSLGTLVALITMGLLVTNQLQKIIRTDVLDRVGQETAIFRSPPQLESPHQVAAFLNETVDQDSVIETWERELRILTDHRYHFPDQSLLAKTHAAVYHGRPQDYALDADYFCSVRPSHVVIGWYARLNQIYDVEFLANHGNLIATLGQNQWRYDIYELDQRYWAGHQSGCD